MNSNTNPRFYMCPPEYFEIKHLLNDWMEATSKIDKDAAMQQWESLRAVYEDLGARVTIIKPIAGIPEMTFAGDSILLFGDKSISSRFRYAERQPEVAPMTKWFKNLGYVMHQLPDGIHFEGNAESIVWNGKLFGGYGIRSDKEAYLTVADVLNVEVIPLKLQEPFYHLDTAFCPLNQNTIAYVPTAFDEPSRTVVAGLAKNMIAIDPDEARLMACNSKTVGDSVVISTKKAPNFVREARRNGLNVVELELTEFRKAGAGAKCLTLEAY